MAELTLYTYWRNSAAFRVRIALNLKGIAYRPEFVHLTRRGGAQHGEPFRAVNPQGRIPVLVDGRHVLTQSLAIIEYLEEMHPEPPLLPRDPMERAWVRAIANLIACDIHPLNNLSVLACLRESFGAEDLARERWMCHWMRVGFEAVEKMLESPPRRGQFCLGDEPTLADAVLIPQVYNAIRFHCPLQAFPRIRDIYDTAMLRHEFLDAAPESQPDREP